MDCCASTRTSPHALHARGLHTSQPLGPTSAAEQEGHLRSPVPHQCGDPSRSGARSKTSRCGDRLLQCVAYLEPTTQAEPSLMMPGITISFLFSEQSSLIFRATPL